MLDYFAIFIGSIVTLFIVVMVLVIFAPKTNNFFDTKTLYPHLYCLSNNKDIINKTFINVGLDTLNDDMLINDYKKYKEFEENRPVVPWVKWPYEKISEGDIDFLPMYYDSKLNKDAAKIFNSLYEEIKSNQDIRRIFFIKMMPNSKLIKHKGLASETNNTLRYIYCFNSFCFYDTDCGIWINGEIKKMSKDNYYIFDASKEHSIYNNTYDPVIFLIIDVDRHKSLPLGTSDALE